MNNNTPDDWLSRLVWNPERYAEQMNDLLDAIEVQLAIDEELAEEIASLENSGEEG